ncbi:Fmp42p NDAI_0K00960 [Naumovozyma dairenensis CBS 421]|uniref:Protein FMP42 n=1 Tax=Naumovozyma dairenensis (strain ATCC 10597 / BCRC 20456 / CBS 421 / NBRC 0211 / NRRL Y-12639) TaxID=1071378 RepID=G0WHM6_NAUDC|nr:hypothetical protein NDAI_0K00960 [Naumovozyma dairenensis CBS 421]CCD27287.1 hypothetical protein NDAI_0K00960 [Naumovozyma dairenensis CBS 421]
MQGSKSLHVSQICCATLWCLLSSGIIFGFAALKPILISEGIYSEFCLNPESNQIDTIIKSAICSAQDLKLNFIFTASAGITNMMALPVGWILDTYGPRITGIIGSFFLTLGALLFIFHATFVTFIDPYISGYIMLSVGGPFVFISCFQLANIFPRRSGSVLALLTGAFDSSSALFLGYRVFYQKVNPSFNLSKFFTLYLIVPLFIFICQVTIMPHESYKTCGNVAKITVEGLDESGHLVEGDDGSMLVPDPNERELLIAQLEDDEQREPSQFHRESGIPLGRRKSVLETYVETKLEEKSGGIFGVLHGYSVIDQLKTPWFYLLLIFAIISMIRINYFIATIRSQEEYLLGDELLASKINEIFDLALPIGGVLSIPFIGVLLDHVKTFNVLKLLSCMSVIIAVLGLIPNSFFLNLIGILVLVIFRPFYYTVISDYATKVFGFETFGTVYGLLICISGICNMGQSLLDQLTHTKFDMNPTPVNLGLLLITIFSSGALLIYINIQLKKQNRSVNLNDEALEPLSDPHTD